MSISFSQKENPGPRPGFRHLNWGRGGLLPGVSQDSLSEAVEGGELVGSTSTGGETTWQVATHFPPQIQI